MKGPPVKGWTDRKFPNPLFRETTIKFYEFLDKNLGELVVTSLSNKVENLELLDEMDKYFVKLTRHFIISVKLEFDVILESVDVWQKEWFNRIDTTSNMDELACYFRIDGSSFVHEKHSMSSYKQDIMIDTVIIYLMVILETLRLIESISSKKTTYIVDIVMNAMIKSVMTNDIYIQANEKVLLLNRKIFSMLFDLDFKFSTDKIYHCFNSAGSRRQLQLLDCLFFTGLRLYPRYNLEASSALVDRCWGCFQSCKRRRTRKKFAELICALLSSITDNITAEMNMPIWADTVREVYESALACFNKSRTFLQILQMLTLLVCYSDHDFFESKYRTFFEYLYLHLKLKKNREVYFVLISRLVWTRFLRIHRRELDFKMQIAYLMECTYFSLKRSSPVLPYYHYAKLVSSFGYKNFETVSDIVLLRGLSKHETIPIYQYLFGRINTDTSCSNDKGSVEYRSLVVKEGIYLERANLCLAIFMTILHGISSDKQPSFPHTFIYPSDSSIYDTAMESQGTDYGYINTSNTRANIADCCIFRTLCDKTHVLGINIEFTSQTLELFSGHMINASPAYQERYFKFFEKIYELVCIAESLLSNILEKVGGIPNIDSCVTSRSEEEPQSLGKDTHRPGYNVYYGSMSSNYESTCVLFVEWISRLLSCIPWICYYASQSRLVKDESKSIVYRCHIDYEILLKALAIGCSHPQDSSVHKESYRSLKLVFLSNLKEDLFSLWVSAMNSFLDQYYIAYEENKYYSFLNVFLVPFKYLDEIFRERQKKIFSENIWDANNEILTTNDLEIMMKRTIISFFSSRLEVRRLSYDMLLMLRRYKDKMSKEFHIDVIMPFYRVFDILNESVHANGSAQKCTVLMSMLNGNFSETPYSWFDYGVAHFIKRLYICYGNNILELCMYIYNRLNIVNTSLCNEHKADEGTCVGGSMVTSHDVFNQIHMDYMALCILGPQMALYKKDDSRIQSSNQSLLLISIFYHLEYPSLVLEHNSYENYSNMKLTEFKSLTKSCRFGRYRRCLSHLPLPFVLCLLDKVYNTFEMMGTTVNGVFKKINHKSIPKATLTYKHFVLVSIWVNVLMGVSRHIPSLSVSFYKDYTIYFLSTIQHIYDMADSLQNVNRLVYIRVMDMFSELIGGIFGTCFDVHFGTEQNHMTSSRGSLLTKNAQLKMVILDDDLHVKLLEFFLLWYEYVRIELLNRHDHEGHVLDFFKMTSEHLKTITNTLVEMMIYLPIQKSDIFLAMCSGHEINEKINVYMAKKSNSNDNGSFALQAELTFAEFRNIYKSCSARSISLDGISKKYNGLQENMRWIIDLMESEDAFDNQFGAKAYSFLLTHRDPWTDEIYAKNLHTDVLDMHALDISKHDCFTNFWDFTVRNLCKSIFTIERNISQHHNDQMSRGKDVNAQERYTISLLTSLNSVFPHVFNKIHPTSSNIKARDIIHIPKNLDLSHIIDNWLWSWGLSHESNSCLDHILYFISLWYYILTYCANLCEDSIEYFDRNRFLHEVYNGSKEGLRQFHEFFCIGRGLLRVAPDFVLGVIDLQQTKKNKVSCGSGHVRFSSCHHLHSFILDMERTYGWSVGMAICYNMLVQLNVWIFSEMDLTRKNTKDSETRCLLDCADRVEIKNVENKIKWDIVVVISEKISHYHVMARSEDCILSTKGSHLVLMESILYKLFCPSLFCVYSFSQYVLQGELLHNIITKMNNRYHDKMYCAWRTIVKSIGPDALMAWISKILFQKRNIHCFSSLFSCIIVFLSALLLYISRKDPVFYVDHFRKAMIKMFSYIWHTGSVSKHYHATHHKSGFALDTPRLWNVNADEMLFNTLFPVISQKCEEEHTYIYDESLIMFVLFGMLLNNDGCSHQYLTDDLYEKDLLFVSLIFINEKITKQSLGTISRNILYSFVRSIADSGVTRREERYYIIRFLEMGLEHNMESMPEFLSHIQNDIFLPYDPSENKLTHKISIQHNNLLNFFELRYQIFHIEFYVEFLGFVYDNVKNNKDLLDWIKSFFHYFSGCLIRIYDGRDADTKAEVLILKYWLLLLSHTTFVKNLFGKKDPSSRQFMVSMVTEHMQYLARFLNILDMQIMMYHREYVPSDETQRKQNVSFSFIKFNFILVTDILTSNLNCLQDSQNVGIDYSHMLKLSLDWLNKLDHRLYGLNYEFMYVIVISFLQQNKHEKEYILSLFYELVVTRIVSIMKTMIVSLDSNIFALLSSDVIETIILDLLVYFKNKNEEDTNGWRGVFFICVLIIIPMKLFLSSTRERYFSRTRIMDLLATCFGEIYNIDTEGLFVSLAKSLLLDNVSCAITDISNILTKYINSYSDMFSKIKAYDEFRNIHDFLFSILLRSMTPNQSGDEFMTKKYEFCKSLLQSLLRQHLLNTSADDSVTSKDADECVQKTIDIPVFSKELYIYLMLRYGSDDGNEDHTFLLDVYYRIQKRDFCVCNT